MIKYLLVAVLAVVGSQAAFSQYTTLNAIPMCWRTAGGIDSTIYMTQGDANQKQKPDRYYYYNAAGLKVTVTGGSLRFGHCELPTVDSIILHIDNLADILDSIQANTTEPQLCNCDYRIDLYDQTLTIDTNASQAKWIYNQTILRDCGAGEEIIASIPTTTLIPKVYHVANTLSALSNGGVVDSSKVFYNDASADFFKIYLSPHMVKIKYPAWPGDTSHLRFNTATYARMQTALNSVLNYAIEKWATDNSLPSPQRDANFTVTPSGLVFMFFNLIHYPTGNYLNLKSGSTNFWYHITASGASTNATAMGFAGAGKNVTHTWATPCGSNVSCSYQCNAVNSADVQVAFDSIELIMPLDTNQFGDIRQTCPGPCPEDNGCVEICNSSENPIPVTIITSATDCPLTGVVEFPLVVTSASSTLPGNLYHSVTISITSGTVILSAVNTAGTTSATFTSGQVFSAQAADCELIPTSFTVNATSGAATVATSK